MATIYKVWGWDTFAHESYSCGEFNSYEEALERCRELEAEVEKSQPADLRDTYSIQTTTEEDLREEERRRDEFLGHQLAEQSYDVGELRNHLKDLLQRLVQAMEAFDTSAMKVEEYKEVLKIFKDGLHPVNCFNEIIFSVNSLNADSPDVALDLKLVFPTTDYNGGGNISCFLLMDTYDKVKDALLCEATLELAYSTVQRLVDKFYK